MSLLDILPIIWPDAEAPTEELVASDPTIPIPLELREFGDDDWPATAATAAAAAVAELMNEGNILLSKEKDDD